jgi:hypothetical protein
MYLKKEQKEKKRNDKTEGNVQGNPLNGNEGDYELSPCCGGDDNKKTNDDEPKVTFLKDIKHQESWKLKIGQSHARNEDINKFVAGHIKKKAHVFGIAQHGTVAINAFFGKCFKCFGIKPLKASIVCVTLSLRLFRACPHPPSALVPPRWPKQVPASQQAPHKNRLGRAPLRSAGAPRQGLQCDELQNKAVAQERVPSRIGQRL